MKAIATPFSCLALLFFPTACGGGFSSGFEGDARLDELTLEETTELCESEAEYRRRRLDEEFQKEMSCYVFAISVARGSGEACLSELESCLDREPRDRCVNVREPASDATIAEYEQCVEDTLQRDLEKEREAKARFTFECEPDGWDDELRWMDESKWWTKPESCDGVAVSWWR